MTERTETKPWYTRLVDAYTSRSSRDPLCLIRWNSYLIAGAILVSMVIAAIRTPNPVVGLLQLALMLAVAFGIAGIVVRVVLPRLVYRFFGFGMSYADFRAFLRELDKRPRRKRGVKPPEPGSTTITPIVVLAVRRRLRAIDTTAHTPEEEI